MIHRFSFVTLILAPFAMTIFVTGAAYIMGKSVANHEASGAASAAVVFVIAGTWLCGLALNIADRVAMRQLDVREATFNALAPETEYRELQATTFFEPVKIVYNNGQSALLVHIPPRITPAQMNAFAFGVLRGNRPIVFREWIGRGKTFSKTQFQDLIGVMRQNGLVADRTHGRAGGVELVYPLGWQFLTRFLEGPPPPLRLRPLKSWERRTPARGMHKE